MPLAIKRALKGICFRTNHQVGIVACAQVDVCSQHAVHFGTHLDKLCKVIQVLGSSNGKRQCHRHILSHQTCQRKKK